MKRCGFCWSITDDRTDICPKCRKELTNYTYICNNCGRVLQDSELYCPKCKAKRFSITNRGHATKEVLQKFFNVNGRVSRSEFIPKIIILKILYISIAFVIFGFIIGDPNSYYGSTNAEKLGFLIVMLINCAMTFPICIRRLHDLGLSGWYVLPSQFNALSSLIIILILCFAKGDKVCNEYGEAPYDSIKFLRVENKLKSMMPSSIKNIFESILSKKKS